MASAWTSGNFDGAATIDLTDLADVLNNFGESYGSAPSIAAPEAASMMVVFASAPLLLMRRKRRPA